MLEKWLENEPEVVAQRIIARQNLEAANRERNADKKAEREVQSLLFGRGLDRFGVLPGDNFPAFEAIAEGLLMSTGVQV